MNASKYPEISEDVWHSKSPFALY